MFFVASVAFAIVLTALSCKLHYLMFLCAYLKQSFIISCVTDDKQVPKYSGRILVQLCVVNFTFNARCFVMSHERCYDQVYVVVNALMT